MNAKSVVRFVAWSVLAAAIWTLAVRRLFGEDRAPGTDTVAHPSPPPQPGPDDPLDEAIAESFPASDPPAYPTRRDT